MKELAPNTFQGLAQAEVELFQKVLKGVKGIGVEIGCLDGFSSRVILEASELHLTSVDPFCPDSMEPSLIGSEEKYRHNVKPWEKRSRLMRECSNTAAWKWMMEPWAADFVFIDGDHNYAVVKKDLEDWSNILKTGGLLAMHDARMGREGGANYHPGPSQVAKEMIFGRPDEWDIVGEAHSLVIARKR